MRSWNLKSTLNFTDFKTKLFLRRLLKIEPPELKSSWIYYAGFQVYVNESKLGKILPPTCRSCTIPCRPGRFVNWFEDNMILICFFFLFFTCVLLNVILIIIYPPGHQNFRIFENNIIDTKWEIFVLQIWLFWICFCPITISLLLRRWTFSCITLKNWEFCSVHTARFVKYVWPFFNIMCGKKMY